MPRAASRAISTDGPLSLALIFTNRSWSRVILSSSLKDPTLWVVTGGALLFLALVIWVPPLAHLFRYASLGPLDVLLCVGGGALGITWFEGVKLLGLGRRPLSRPFRRDIVTSR